MESCLDLRDALLAILLLTEEATRNENPKHHYISSNSIQSKRKRKKNMTYRRYVRILKSLLEAIIVFIMIRTAGKNHTINISYFFILKWIMYIVTLCRTLNECTQRYVNVRLHTTMYNIANTTRCSTIYNDVRQCTTMYNKK